MVMVHHTPPAEALAAHLINQTVHSVSILESLNLISPADARTIRAKLLSSAGPFPSLALPTQPESDISSSFGSLNVAGGSSSLFGAQSSVPSLPPRGRLSGSETKARALWDYHGTEGDDLAFKAGDTIVIEEEVNEQWYRGRVIPQGQTFPHERSGLFPSNYVEKTPARSVPPAPPYYSTTPPPIGPQAMIHYQPAPPQQTYYDQKPPMQQGQVVTIPPQQQVQGGVIQQDQQEARKNQFGKIGGQLQNAAITGAGFGFGSAVASNIVNKIF